MLSPVFHGMLELVLSLCGREQGSWQGVERLESHKYVTGIAQQLGADSLHRPQAGEKQQLNWIKTIYDLTRKVGMHLSSEEFGKLLHR